MIRSMTAFGKSQLTEGGTSYEVEIRSLNSRFRDIRLSLPYDMRSFEDDIRSLLTKRIRRGRIEMNVRVVRSEIDNHYDVIINRPMIEAYLKALNDISNEFEIDLQPSFESLYFLKDAILLQAQEPERESIWGILSQAINASIDALDEMKIAEGAVIEQDIHQRLRAVESHMDEIEARASMVIEEYREKLEKRLKDFLKDVDFQEDRVLQEVAIFADRSDISEEILRVRSHIQQMRNTLRMDDAIGRRLEFLLQEVNREVNTISSKAGDALISQRVVDIKAELEKMREQVQNIE